MKHYFVKFEELQNQVIKGQKKIRGNHNGVQQLLLYDKSNDYICLQYLQMNNLSKMWKVHCETDRQIKQRNQYKNMAYQTNWYYED